MFSFFSLVKLSERHTRFRENASIPGGVYACSRSPGSSTRPCAVIHLCEGPWASRAAWARLRAGGELGWVLSLGVEVAGPWSSRGSRGGLLSCQAGQGSPRSSRGLSAQIFRRRNNGARAIKRTPVWVGGAFADSPKTWPEFGCSSPVIKAKAKYSAARELFHTCAAASHTYDPRARRSFKSLHAAAHRERLATCCSI